MSGRTRGEGAQQGVAGGLSLSERIDFVISRRLPVVSRKLNVLAFRLSGGRLGGAKRGIPIGLLTVPGRRSGELRTVPLMYMRRGEIAYVVASNGGSSRPPAWYLNLRAADHADWRTREARRRVVAEEVKGEARELVWPELVRLNPLWAAYQDCTDRQTVVVSLRAA